MNMPLTPSPRRTWRRWMLAPVALLTAGALVSLAVVGADAPPNIRAANIATDPLYAATQGDKPALALALSVEFPTVGAQYVDVPNTNEDASYSPSNEYLGHFNSETCYRYVDTPTETPAAGKTATDYKRFQISGAATGRRCGDGFSGNFLNWASSSAIDMLRVALSGGDRSIDETGLTILQRAVLPNGDPTCMWNSNNFPAKKLLKGKDGDYAGAIPQAMIKATKGADSVWVANTLNRIYFSTTKGGNCNATGTYNLSGPDATLAMDTPVSKNGPLPKPTPPACAAESGTCTSSTVKEIWYGAGNRWMVAPFRGTVGCNNATFTDPASGVGKSCYIFDYAGSWTPPGSGGTPLNSEGLFYARAEVCNKSGSDLVDQRDFNLCTRYPNGNYKPTGTIQKYNDQLRLAAFGYALEQTLSWDGNKGGRYGGVLRAPMKFVGPRTYDVTGGENTPTGGNPATEWDALTGIYRDNPDGDTTFGVSGVINYLNKFGRTGPTPGRYKQYDPASELYYESLRYLQGLPPSPAAVANLDLTNASQKAFYDGFPIYRDWKELDPYGGARARTSDYSCLKSNIALIGDINTWDSRYGTGNNGNSRMATTDIAKNVPDIEHWISVVQAFEKAQAMSYVDGQGVTRTTSNPNAANSAPNTRGPQTYGLAYWAHTHDIRGAAWTDQPDKQRPGLRVKSYFFDVNEYGGSSGAAGRRKNNQYFTAAKYGGFNSQPSLDASIPYNTQGNPFYDTTGTADNNVWQDPANPNEAQTYFLQSNARGVLAAFDKIFSDAASAQRSIAGAAAASSNLTQSGSYVYQASYDTSNWTGDVQAFTVKVGSDNATIDMTNGAVWSAENELANRLLAGTPARNIVVGKRGANPSPVATLFTTGAIEPALQADLNRYSPTAAEDGLWQDRVAYLRGSKAKEGSPFRRRYRALGDIVNSGVQYVGAPSPSRSLGDGYADFATAAKDRTTAVYAGVNDGMLHAFNAKTGSELFAYIPSWLGSKLSALTDPGYRHQTYVDATPVIGDAKVGSGSTATDWKSVLVSGSGGGGRGVFALDVTDPSDFGPSKVMWEFTEANDRDMGYVLGKPRIVRMKTSAPSATTTTYRWFAMVPAGVNNYVKKDASDDNFSRTGAPTIFLLALDKPAGTEWTSTGSSPNYYKITLPFDAATAVNNPTGVLNLEAYMNGNGVTEYVYAGDLHGRVWALDFTAFGTEGWTAGQLSRFNTGSAGLLTAYPMFIARDSGGAFQPISAAPTILQGADADKHFIGFGTGKYFETGDAKTTAQNTYYVLYDNGSGSASGGTSGVVGIQGRGRLRQVTSDTSGNLNPTSAFTWGRATSDGDTSRRSGWYYDMPATGERVVYDSVYLPLTTKAAFSSLIPDSATTPGVCSVSGGTGNSYYVDLLAGTGKRLASTVGILGQPMVMFNDEGTTETKADSTGRRMRTRPIILGQQGSKGIDAKKVADETYPVGRLSWRQINNYLELHNK